MAHESLNVEELNTMNDSNESAKHVNDRNFDENDDDEIYEFEMEEYAELFSPETGHTIMNSDEEDVIQDSIEHMTSINESENDVTESAFSFMSVPTPIKSPKVEENTAYMIQGNTEVDFEKDRDEESSESVEGYSSAVEEDLNSVPDNDLLLSAENEETQDEGKEDKTDDLSSHTLESVNDQPTEIKKTEESVIARVNSHTCVDTPVNTTDQHEIDSTYTTLTTPEILENLIHESINTAVEEIVEEEYADLSKLSNELEIQSQCESTAYTCDDTNSNSVDEQTISPPVESEPLESENMGNIIHEPINTVAEDIVDHAESRPNSSLLDSTLNSDQTINNSMGTDLAALPVGYEVSSKEYYSESADIDASYLLGAEDKCMKRIAGNVGAKMCSNRTDQANKTNEYEVTDGSKDDSLEERNLKGSSITYLEESTDEEQKKAVKACAELNQEALAAGNTEQISFCDAIKDSTNFRVDKSIVEQPTSRETSDSIFSNSTDSTLVAYPQSCVVTDTPDEGKQDFDDFSFIDSSPKTTLVKGNHQSSLNIITSDTFVDCEIVHNSSNLTSTIDELSDIGSSDKDSVHKESASVSLNSNVNKMDQFDAFSSPKNVIHNETEKSASGSHPKAINQFSIFDSPVKTKDEVVGSTSSCVSNTMDPFSVFDLTPSAEEANTIVSTSNGINKDETDGFSVFDSSNKDGYSPAETESDKIKDTPKQEDILICFSPEERQVTPDLDNDLSLDFHRDTNCNPPSIESKDEGDLGSLISFSPLQSSMNPLETGQLEQSNFHLESAVSNSQLVNIVEDKIEDRNNSESKDLNVYLIEDPDGTKFVSKEDSIDKKVATTSSTERKFEDHDPSFLCDNVHSEVEFSNVHVLTSKESGDTVCVKEINDESNSDEFDTFVDSETCPASNGLVSFTTLHSNTNESTSDSLNRRKSIESTKSDGSWGEFGDFEEASTLELSEEVFDSVQSNSINSLDPLSTKSEGDWGDFGGYDQESPNANATIDSNRSSLNDFGEFSEENSLPSNASSKLPTYTELGSNFKLEESTEVLFDSGFQVEYSNDESLLVESAKIDLETILSSPWIKSTKSIEVDEKLKQLLWNTTDHRILKMPDKKEEEEIEFSLIALREAISQKLHTAVVHQLLVERSEEYNEYFALIRCKDMDKMLEGLRNLQELLLGEAATNSMVKMAQQAALSAEAALSMQSTGTSRNIFSFGSSKGSIPDAIADKRDCDSNSMRILTPTGISVHRIGFNSNGGPSSDSEIDSGYDSGSGSEMGSTTGDSCINGDIDQIETNHEVIAQSHHTISNVSTSSRTLMKKFTKFTASLNASRLTKQQYSIKLRKHEENSNVVDMHLDMEQIHGGFDEIKWQCATTLYTMEELTLVAPSKIFLYSYPDDRVLKYRNDKTALYQLVKPNTIWSVNIQGK